MSRRVYESGSRGFVSRRVYESGSRRKRSLIPRLTDSPISRLTDSPIPRLSDSPILRLSDSPALRFILATVLYQFLSITDGNLLLNRGGMDVPFFK